MLTWGKKQGTWPWKERLVVLHCTVKRLSSGMQKRLTNRRPLDDLRIREGSPWEEKKQRPEEKERRQGKKTA